MLADIGLFLSPSKSELVKLGLDEMIFLRETQCINFILENVSFAKKEDVILLGSPLTSTAIRPQFQHKLSIFNAMTEKLSILDRYPAYFLLINCFSMDKLMYLLRSSPTFQHPDLHADFVDCLKSCATYICNVSFDDIDRIQATLPISLEGIGLRRASDLALPAYLASISASQSLISKSTQPDNIPLALDSCFDVWSSTNPSLPENPNLQRQWDDIKSSSRSATLRPLLDQHRLACLSSATQPNSGAWMNCLPSTAIGTLLDNESFRIAISQRLGLSVCAPHKCHCGAIVDRYGLHPLSYRHSAGRLPRHSDLIDIIKRALSSVGFNGVLEPVGLDRCC